MKIALPADRPSLDAQVQNRLGTTPYLLIVDPEDMSFEVLNGPPPTLGPGAGVQALTIALGKGATVILVGYISPNISRPLQKAAYLPFPDSTSSLKLHAQSQVVMPQIH